MLNNAFCILHISDIHRNEDGRVENNPLYTSLLVDAERYTDRQLENLPKPAVIIVSGDLVFGSSQEDMHVSAKETRMQYEEANDFLTLITNEFLDGDKKRIIVIPGNHDVNWSISKASMKLIDISATDVKEKKVLANQLLNSKNSIRWSWEELVFYKIEDEDLYNTRLKYFAEFYSKFYEGKRAYSMDPHMQFDIFDIPELNITIAGFNSCFRNDHLNKSGLINVNCLSSATLRLMEYKRKGRQLLATWHHNISGIPTDSTYLDPRQIKLLISTGFSIGFHGHQHLSDIVENYVQFDSSRKLVAISAGTLCSARSHLPDGYKRQYNLLKLDHSSGSCHLYSRENTGNMDDAPIWDKGRINESLESSMEIQIIFPSKPLDIVSEKDVDRLSIALRNDDYQSFLAIINTIPIDDLVIRSLVIDFNKQTRGKYRKEVCTVLVKPISIREYLIFMEYYTELGRRPKSSPHETLPVEEDFEFFKLPEPSVHDIFFQIESDSFVGTLGLEYLFGWLHKNIHHQLWAINEVEEKQALEAFVDTIMRILENNPAMHIYHFGPHEQSALKRLAGKCATRVEELDRLLRAGVFVNLHSLTRLSIIAGVGSYSLRDLEMLRGYLRIADIKTANPHKYLYEGLLESGNINAVDEQTKNIVRDYNKDDCISTEHLRNWLEIRREELISNGSAIPRPEAGDSNPSENRTEHQQRIQPLFNALVSDLPVEKENRTPEQQARWLLANMLGWYRREQKSFWWEVFRLQDLTDEELLEERDPLSGLTYTGTREKERISYVDYYTFPEQETTLSIGNSVQFKGQQIGIIHSLDLDRKIVCIRKRKLTIDTHPTHLIGCDYISDKAKEEAIIRLAEWVIQNGIDAHGSYRAGRDLLLRKHPRTTGDILTFNSAQEQAVEWAKKLDNGVLPIQGPPGTGKNHTAAKMILSLVKEGKKIGVTAMSYKVISALLNKVVNLAEEEHIIIRIVQKVRLSEANTDDPNFILLDDNTAVLENLVNGFDIAAGTSFMWARESFFEAVDYLFVDEAGQLSLIDAVTLSHAGKNLVLLGDPQQLKQPDKRIHPEGTEVSALEHILQGQQTISREQGVFLNNTWRMPLAINTYISELFYEGRLRTMAQNEQQHLQGITKFKTPGIYFEPVIHHGNQNISVEEVERVEQIVDELLSFENYRINSEGDKQRLSPENIKIISPYKAQVNSLLRVLPQIQIGTVDKFQGQEAAIIILSMASSSAEDAPRGMEFLYSLNRLNVAISRANNIFILVASPTLLETQPRSPHQMGLINAFRRLKEIADK